MGRRCEAPPFLSLTLLLFLRCLAGSLGFGALGLECLFGAHVDLDLLGFRFRFLGKLDFQDPFVVLGLNVITINRVWERKRAGKAAILPLNPAEVLLFLFLLELALAMHD